MRKILFTLLGLSALAPASLHAQCNPQFTWAPAPVNNNLLSVTFTNTTATPSTGYTVYTADFGDNTTGYMGGTTVHNYTSPGTYTVALYMVTSDSMTQTVICQDTAYQQVTVGYPACGATIAYQDNGNGTYTFTASNPAGTPGLSYSWNFGDGSTTTGNPATHTYTSGGGYTVTLTVTGGGCSYSNSIVLYPTLPLVCDTLEAHIYAATSGMTVQCYNYSTYVPYSVHPNVVNSSNWYFGDGATSTQLNANHTYSTPGTYTITLINHWVDSLNQAVYCSDTTTTQVTVSAPQLPNYISGAVYWDSLTGPSPDSIKVWLIVHDSIANTLTAVDSQYIAPNYAYYQFNNPASGAYRVKAAVQNQPAGTAGWLPTDHYSSLYWSGANVIVHTGGTTSGKDILLQPGTVAAGPGFIGGNISSGAGKGTGTGVPDLLVLLRDNTNKVIAATYTDAEGNYAFDQIAEGTYNIYPEAINYTTTPSPAIHVGQNDLSVDNVDFTQSDVAIVPTSALSVKALQKEDGLEVYPNPAHDRLIIDNRDGSFHKATLVNVLGQSVLHPELKKGINTVQTAALTPGIYYLLVQGRQGARSLKISIK